MEFKDKFRAFIKEVRIAFEPLTDRLSDKWEHTCKTIMRCRVLGLIGLLVFLAVGLGAADWLAAMSGVVIMAMSGMLHEYRKREGF
jgi:hypothetical protein